MRSSRFIAVVLVAMLAFGACASGDKPASSAAKGSAAKKSSKKQGKGAAGNKKVKGSKGGKGTQVGDGPVTATEKDNGAGVTEAPKLEPSNQTGARFARLSAHVEEPEPDAEKDGLTPPYSEATAVDVEGLGKDLRITMSFGGSIPQKMPTDNTYMVIGFGMSGKSKKEGGYFLGAQATDEGWQAYAGGKEDTDRFPGTFFVRDNTIEMTVPWSYVGGPRAFEWYANSSWFQSTQSVTSYAFDVIPNGKGHYPG